MTLNAILEYLEEQLPGATIGSQTDAIDPTIDVEANRWGEVARVLRHDATLGFNFLNCITGIDYCEPDAKKAAKVDWQPHIEVLYHLTSLSLRHRLVVRLNLPRWRDNKPGKLPTVPSVAHLWSTADWHEREVYDLVGVEFANHPDLRRILCPEDWPGHPLRKDYQMPLEYHGIRGR